MNKYICIIIMQSLCNFYAMFMQSLCKRYANFMQSLCNVYAEFMQCLCKVYGASTGRRSAGPADESLHPVPPTFGPVVVVSTSDPTARSGPVSAIACPIPFEPIRCFALAAIAQPQHQLALHDVR